MTKRSLYIGPKDRKKLDKLWEQVHFKGISLEPIADPYLRMLMKDWKRCSEMGIDPNMRKGVMLPEGDYEEIRKDKQFLVDKAGPVVDKVHHVLCGVPFILIITDDKGTILYVAGDPSVRSKAAEESNLVEGARWDESSVGSNGIGTAITKATSVHVYAAEHFCQGWHQWTCAASPILNPFTGEVIGAVDFTTMANDYRDDAVGLTYSLASHVMTEIRLQLELERMSLIQSYASHSSRYPSDRIVVLDRMDHVVRSSTEVNQADCKAYLVGDTATATPKEIRSIYQPGTDMEIGTLLVVGRPEKPHHCFPPRSRCATFGGFITANEPLMQKMEQIDKIISADLNVLIVGETGTGKELVARYIHNESKRRAGPYVVVNCGAISKELFESRFFGYERGAFTGADSRGRKGFFECANGGTLFLDEIGELPFDIQAALLRVIETRRFRRIGAEVELTTDCRIVAATNRSLLEDVERGAFRADLYYRLNVARMVVPPLRERLEDIPVLVDYFARRFCQEHDLPPTSFTAEALEILTQYPWPGNAREIHNVVSSTILVAGNPITPSDLPVEIMSSKPVPSVKDGETCSMSFVRSDQDFSISNLERELIIAALRKYRKVDKVAKALGISRATLYRKFQALQVDHRVYQ